MTWKPNYGPVGAISDNQVLRYDSVTGLAQGSSMTIGDDGAVIVKTTTNSNIGFQVKNSSDQSIVRVNTLDPENEATGTYRCLYVIPKSGAIAGSGKTTYGLESQMYFNSGSQTAGAGAMRGRTRFSGSSTQGGVAVRGIEALVEWLSSSAGGPVVGVENSVYTGSASGATGTVANAYGQRCVIGFYGSATSAAYTNAFNFFIQTPFNTHATNATITNLYGLYVQDMKVAGVTNSYGVYVEDQSAGGYAVLTGTGIHEFGDDVFFTLTTNSSGAVIRKTAEVSTTDATVTTVKTFSTDTDTVHHITATIVGTETTDYDEAASYMIVGTFKNDGGTLTQVGTTSALHVAEDTVGWDVNFNISGTDVQVQVTGAASTNVNWACSLQTLSIA